MNLNLISEYFDSLADVWDRNQNADPQKIGRILDACGIEKGHRVIDVACGTGVLFEHLLVRQPEHVMGIDISKAMIERARSKFCDRRLCLKPQDFLELDSEGFDRAVLYNAYPHFFDKAALAKKIHEVLGRKGRFVLAHSRGRHSINNVHRSKKAKAVSIPLKAADREAEWFKPFFEIDTLRDTQDIYIIAGTKK